MDRDSAREQALEMLLDLLAGDDISDHEESRRKERVEGARAARMTNPLCDICQTLDLEKTNVREAAQYSLGPWEGIVRKSKKRPPCPFCVLMKEMKSWRGAGQDVSIEWKEEGGFFCSVAGVNLAFLNEDTAQSPYGSARAVRSHIDPELIKKWMTLCEDLHESCKPKRGILKTSEGDGLKVLRLIDTEDQCIVDAEPGVRYLALSYVWGAVVPSVRLQRNNLAKLCAKEGIRALRRILPKTINDAIDLVRVIGERYLWIDSLCLIQDDESDMLDGIAHMDLVYQCAALTIIAAHGADANSGLPGVHPGSRVVHQKIVEVLPGIRMTSTTGVYHTFADSAHANRGWTFQELVLSHRTLIFTENCIYFRCRANCWSEDTIYDNFPSAINKVLDSGNGTPFLDDEQPKPLSALGSQLSRYSTRKLTKESDMIHAFTGILRHISVRTKSGLLEGLFTASFDICLISWCNYPRSFTLGRRGEFPSWSWAGWRGICVADDGFGSNADELNSFLENKTYIVWYKRSHDTGTPELVWSLSSQLQYGQPEKHHIGYRPNTEDSYGRPPPDEMSEKLRTNPDDSDLRRERIIREAMKKRNYYFLDFFAYVVFLQGFEDPPEREAWAQWYWVIGSDDTKCGRIKFDDPKLMQDVCGPYELVILSMMDKYEYRPICAIESPFFWVMLIVWQGKKKAIAERRGIGYLYQDCMDHVLYPGKVWKEIVLA